MFTSNLSYVKQECQKEYLTVHMEIWLTKRRLLDEASYIFLFETEGIKISLSWKPKGREISGAITLAQEISIPWVDQNFVIRENDSQSLKPAVLKISNIDLVLFAFYVFSKTKTQKPWLNNTS